MGNFSRSPQLGGCYRENIGFYTYEGCPKFSLGATSSAEPTAGVGIVSIVHAGTDNKLGISCPCLNPYIIEPSLTSLCNFEENRFSTTNK
jgi:hypothetical protein